MGTNASGNYVPSNIDKAKIKGVKYHLRQQSRITSLWNLNYTYQEPENREQQGFMANSCF